MPWPFSRPKLPARSSTYSSTLSDAYTDDPDAVTPLPWGQMSILCLLRLTEPISFFIVFPFIPALVRELGVAKTDRQVGYYAGIVESLFALSQFATILFWGRLSDRIGRKPVLIIGLTGSAVSIFCFGLSKTFAGIILSRCLNGALNGNVAVLKSIISELSDDTNAARAFSFLPLMAALGTTIGPLIGGYLAHPAEQYPGVFGRSTFFKTYPYALPCLTAAVFTLIGTLLGLCCLRETLSPKDILGEVKEGEEDSAQPLLHETPPASPTAQRFLQAEPELVKGPSSIRELLTGQMLLNVTAYMLLVLASTAYLAILPVFSYTPVELGGIGFSQHEIAIAFAIRGVLAVFLQTVVFPPLCNRIGPAATFRAMVTLYVPLFVCFPLMNHLARIHPDTRWPVWVVMCATVFFWSAANIAFAANMLLVTSMAPTRADLGTIHGLTQSAVSLTRSFAPFTASALFALSVDKNWLNGNFVYAFFEVTSVLLILASWRLKEGQPAWRHHEPIKKRRKRQRTL